MTKVIIELEGGLVQAVYSDDKRVQVAVLDHDVFEDLYPKLDLDAFFFPELDPVSSGLFIPSRVRRCDAFA